jgi:hypothetical protein
MSASDERPAAEDRSSSPSLTPRSSGAGSAGGPGTGPEIQPSKQAAEAANEAGCPREDPTETLKQRLEETRLPPGLKEQVLAELPPPEERERLYRELQEKGGLSFEEFFNSLCAEVGSQP